MRPFTVLVLSLSLVGLMTAPAWAQDNGFANLIVNKSVQQELKISDEQAQEIAVIYQDVRATYREEMSKLVDLPRGPEKRQKIMKVIETMNGGLMKQLPDILTPEQSRRFEQLRLQTSGGVDLASALTRPRIERALKLTDEQKAKLREIHEALDKLMLEESRKANPPSKDAMKYISELQKSANDKAFAVLTDDQKKTWTGLIGDPFEVKY
jgi:hypothetical protein